MNPVLFMAWRLFSRSRGGFLSFMSAVSILGIIVGVAVLIVVIAVMNGFDKELRDKIVANNPHILVYGDDLIELDDKLLTELETSGVERVVPMAYSQVFLRIGDRIQPIFLRGVSRKDIEFLLKGDKILGNFPKEGEVVIGKELAQIFSLWVGDEIEVVSPIASQSRRFKVAGVFESGMYEYDSSLVYGNLGDVQDLLFMPDKVNSIGIYLYDPEEAGKVKEKLYPLLHAEGLRAITWMESNRSLFSALKLEKLVMFLILLLIVLVASFNVISSLVVLVATRTREIGLLKALGFTDGQVYWIFLLIGLIIGLIGAGVGGLLGVGIALAIEKWHIISLPPDVYYIDYLPARVGWIDTLWILISAVLLAVFSSLYPAQKARAIVPALALRYE